MAAQLFESLQSFVINWLNNYVTKQLASVYNYEKTVEELERAVQKLRKEEKDVRDKAEEDEDRYGRERHDDVKGWLVRVEKILSEYEEFQKYEDRKCLNCSLFFPNLKARFDSGKIAEDIKEKVGELQKKKEGDESCCQEGPSSMGDDAIASSSNANNESCSQCHEAIMKLISAEYITNQLANLCNQEKNAEVEEQDKVDKNLQQETDIIVRDTSQQEEYQYNESRCQGPSSMGDDASSSSSSNANVEAEKKGKVYQNLQEETEIIVCDTLSQQEEHQDGGEIDDGEVVSNSEYKKALEKHEDRECLGFALVFPYMRKSYHLGKITEDVEEDSRERQMTKEDIESIMKLMTEFINQLVYMLNPKKKVAELDKVAGNLLKVTDTLRDTSQQEEGQNRRETDDGDKKWLDDVKEILSKVEDLKKREDLQWKWLFLAVPNPITRYRQGKIAEVIKLTVEQLQKETHDNRSWRGPLSIDDVFSNVDYKIFESRKKTMDDIMAALEDPSARMIGVHGSAGVGKTTLVIEAAKQAREGKLFDVMIMVQVTRSHDIRKLQGQIADMLGMTLEDESEQGRAARIKKRLKKPNENILIILDDLYAQVDLKMLGIPIENGDDGKLRNLKELGKSSTPVVHSEEIPSDGQKKLIPEETKSGSEMKKKATLSTGSNKSITKEHHKECKILLISEVRQVLVKQMDGKEKLISSVSNLNDNEAETLFKNMAGIDEKKSEYEKIAAKIARKCGGLPMTIVTTARALKNQNYSVWEDTDRKLERQKLIGTPENSTKLSYQLLENEELKITFLLCARMGQDALISDLVKFCIGLGFLQGVYTIREARDRVQTLLVMLKESGLLSDSYSTDRFTMQNLIRSAALSIASEEKHAFTLTEGKIDEWPEEDKLERYTAISLRRCLVIEKFPESIKCPRLRVFEVENNGSLLEIPDNFFKEMKELRVLCLTGVNLKSLPSSIVFLTKLKMLCLEQCRLSEGLCLCIIEELKNLRILSFSGSDIESLPVQLKYLSKLQVLDISNCSKLKVIPPNVISCLTSLEELYMRNTPIQWSVNEGQESQSENASISELGNLNQLTNLDIQIPSVAHLPKNLFFDKLYSYKIIIGSSNRYLLPGFKMPEKYELSRFLAIQQKDGFDIHSQKGIKMLFERVEDLMLEKLNGVQDIFYALNITGFPCLKHLSIVSNSSIQSLIKPNKRRLPEVAFTKLKSLHLYKVKKMKQICSCESLSKTSFARLKVIKIKLCHELESVFSISMVGHLISLEIVDISECNSLKDIVHMQTSNANKSLKFPNLRSVILQSLSDFIGFYPISLAPAEGTKILFYDEKVAVSKLEIMELSSIPIDQIWAEKNSSFGNLIHLDVKHCENLKYLFSFSVARSLVKLQRLFVSECDRMEHLFFQGQDTNAKEKNCIFPKLKNIKLTRMRSLREIWNFEVPTDSIDNLDTLIIEECDKLVNVFTCYTVEIFQSLCSLTVKNCKSMKAVFDLVDGKRYAKCKTKLQDVHLETLPELEQVLKWKKDQESVVNWNNIRKIWLQDCERVENIFPSSVDKSFKNLEYLVAWDCSRLREIVAKGEEANSNNTNSAIEFKFPELTTIKFVELPNFKSFYPGECKLNCPKLKDLSIEYCDKLEPFREETTNNQERCILFPVEVINNLKSMQIESQYAKLSTGYNYRMDELEELHLSSLSNIEILYSFLHHNPKLKSVWLNDCFFEVLVPLKRPAEIESLGFVPKLKSLNLTNLAWLKKIGFEHDTIFQRIESLILKNCPRLDTIARSFVFFSHLTNLEVVDCDRLKYLVSLRTAESLVQLSIMKVINCNALKEIVSEQGSEAEKEEGREIEENASKFNIVFKQLKALELVSLKSLKSFCRSKSCAFEFPSLEKFVVNACSKLENFTDKVKGTIVLQNVYTVHEKENRWCWKGNLQDTIQYIFQNKKFLEGMEELNVSDHPELEEVWQCKKGLPKDWFFSLKTLKLEACKFEKYAIPSNVLSRLKSLQELEVHGCRNITFIFEMNDIKIRETPLRLKRLTLTGLPNVTHVWKQEQEDKQGILSFKNLQQVSVYRCHQLQTLLPTALARDLKMLEELEVVCCDELRQIVGNKEGAADGTVVFPRLTSLMLNWLPKLTCFYSESFAVECPELDYLDVIDCGKLELFQSQQETDREDQGCSTSNSIIRQTFFSDIKGISKVKKLYLSWKDAKVWLGQSKDQYLQYLRELDLHLGDYEKENFTLPSAILEKAPNLEKMRIVNCSSLKEISAEGMLGHLKRLALHNLDELHSIWVLEYLPKLQQLRVSECPSLTTLMQPSAAKMLTDLEEMYVENCKSMKEIVGKGQEETAVQEIKLERLEMISLIDLSRLKCFYSGNATLQLPSLIQVDILECPEMKSFSQGLKHVEPPSRLIQVSCDTDGDETELVLHPDLNVVVGCLAVIDLEYLVLDDYPALKEIWLGEVQIPFDCLFRNLKSLVVTRRCEFLSNAILPSHLLPILNNLEKLVVRECDYVETIFDVKDTATNNSNMSVIHLKKLILHQLPTLRHVWNEDLKGRLSLPDLEEVIVNECGSIKSLFPASVPRDNLQKLYVRNCAGLVEIVAKEETAATEAANHKLDMFPKVTSLTLRRLPKLRCICSGMSILDWPELEDLDVYGCAMLTIFATDSLGSPDSYLEEGEGHFTSKKHGIISPQKVPPNLERLSLGKENVIMIEQGPHEDLLLQNIKFLTLQGSDKDSDAFPHVFFSKGPLPSIQEFAVVDSAFKEIFPSEIMPHIEHAATRFSSQPKKLELIRLHKLNSIGFEHTWVAPLVENLLHLKVSACTCLTNLAPSTVSFSRLTELNVEDCAGLKYLFTSSTARSLVVLSEMSIINCESLETVVAVVDDEEGDNQYEDVVFPELSNLSLKKLPKLGSFYMGNSTLKFLSSVDIKITQCESMKTFSRGSVEVPELHELKIDGAEFISLTNLASSTVSFSCLTELNVKDCAGLKYLFTSSTARSLVVLSEMSIINCESLETVVTVADDEEGDNPYEDMVFPELSSLSLRNLPKLGSFYMGNSTLKFPSLFDVEITQCKSMKTFSSGNMEVPELHELEIDGAGCTSLTNLAPSTVSFSLLTELNVEDCAGLKYLFTSSTARSLVVLSEMSIINCESLETVVAVADDEEGDNPYEGAVFPELSSLSLKKLPKLGSLFPASFAKGNLKKLYVRNCAETEEIVAKDDETATEEASKKVAVFPKVTSLTLWDLPKLRCICSGMDILDWPMLQDLDVYHCQMLKIFAIDKHGIISVDKVPPNLERLSLSKEDFILIEQGLLPHVNLQLQKIKFLRMQGFNNDSDVLPAEVFFSMVSLPSIQEFEVADSAFKEIFPSQMPGMDFTTKSFSQLEKLELRSLYKLESIGFEHTWVAPLVGNLQDLKVLACTCLTNLAPSTVSFSRLTELNVEDCVGLKYLFTSSTARSLVELGKMSITNCESLESVVAADDEEGDKKDEDVVFPELASLSLRNLPKLGSFYMGNSTLKFRYFWFSVEITQCKSMKTFSHGDVEVCQLGNLEIDGAKWDDDDLNSAVRQQFEKAREQP